MNKTLLAALLLFGCAHYYNSTIPLPASTDCPPGYEIKGNIDLDGDRIFHTPLSPWYDRTKPEVCFQTIEDAFGAGFRPPERW